MQQTNSHLQSERMPELHKFMTTSEIVTDWARNTFDINQQESPGFDPHGARRDRAMSALPDIIKSANVPAKGSRVEIIQGRKHKGKIGTVFYRGRDQFRPRSCYGSDLQRTMSDALGHNDRIGVITDDGEKFFVPLMYSKKI